MSAAPQEPHGPFDPTATVTLPVVWRREDVQSTGARLGCLAVLLGALTWFIVSLVLMGPLKLEKPVAWPLSAVIAVAVVAAVAGQVPMLERVPGQRGQLVDPSAQLAPLSPIGLLGIGAMSPDADAPSGVVTQYQANTTRWGQDPETGDFLVGINPSRVIESGRWDQSPVGDYLRHHRPDLWPAVQQQFDQNQ